jgi:hypothetical protein
VAELADVTRAQSYDSAGALGRAAVAAARVGKAPERDVVEAQKRRRPLALGALVAGVLVAAAGVIALLVSGGDEPSATTQRQSTGPEPARGEPKVEHVALGPRTAPGDVAVDARNVYVTDRRTGDLLFVDTATHKIVHRLRLPDVDYVKPDPYKANRLWASFPDRHLVLQIDTRRGRIVGPRIHVPGEPTLVAATRDSVVVATEPQKHILLRRFDKTTGRRVSGVVRSKGTPTDLDSAAGQIAAVSWIQPALLTYDPRLEHGLQIDLKLPQGTSLAGQAGTELAVGADDVAWMLLDDASPDSFAVVRLSLRSHEQIGTMIALGRGLARDIAVDHGSVWVPNFRGGTVVRIDERSGRVVGGPINVGEIGGDVAAIDGEAWVGGARDLIRITP